MTKFHPHHENHNEFVTARVGTRRSPHITRREFLQSSMVILSGIALPHFLESPDLPSLLQEGTGKRIYIAPDDHTDLFWSADLATYENAFVEMLDYYLDLSDATANEPEEFQSRWNCDGSFWVWTYERKKSRAEFERLIERIRDGHISMPLNALCVCLGGAPAEAVLRGMYYPGKLERRYGLHFPLAYSIENQTLPLGLGALWSGAGATFSWKGTCGCGSQISDGGDREHDIYWWTGMDGSRILMKWNSKLVSNESMGGYAEARDPEGVIHYVNTDEKFRIRYPYQVIGAFGQGWDDLQTQTDLFVSTAKKLTTQNFKVIVSNEIDFAQDFEKMYGNNIPSLSVSFGNEWDLDCTAMAEVSARIKRAVEKLRAAESLAAMVSLQQDTFMQGREEARDLAWMNMGLYWEHDWQGGGDDLTRKRIEWARQITGEIESFVDTLHEDALTSLGGMIRKSGDVERFFIFNPLSWKRTDYADYEFASAAIVHVIDLENNQETPSQFVMKDGKRWLRILVRDIPPVGYKVFEIREGVGQSFSREINVSEGEIENQFYKVTVDGRGAITSLVDKTRGNRQLAANVNGRFINDLGPGAGILQVESEGPVSTTLLAIADEPLAHTSRITLFRDIDRIEIQNDIMQNFNTTYTWSFGFAMQNPDVYHEEVGAILKARLTNDGGHYSPRTARYDWLTLNHFVDVNQGNDFGVTLSNADCYFMRLGNSMVGELDTKTPQISVLVGGNDLNGSAVLNDQGGDKHFLQRFGVKAHDTYDPVSAMKFSLEHQNPFVADVISGGDSYPSDIFSFLEVDNPNVLVWAVKPADDGVDAGIVVRVWNVSQSKQLFSLRFGGAIKQAFHLSHIETPLESVTVQDGAMVDSLYIQQIKTYAVMLGVSGVSALTPVSASVTATPESLVTPNPTVTEAVATPTAVATPVGTPAPNGKGCLLGLLDMLFALLK